MSNTLPVAVIEGAADDAGPGVTVAEDPELRTARSVSMAILGLGGKLVLSACSILVLARLLAPEDFGLVGMVTVVTGFVALFRDTGPSLTTFRHEVASREEVSELFWSHAFLGVGLAGITVAMAPALVAFYGEPRLLWVTMALATGFLFHGSAALHRAVLQRRTRFVSLAIIDILSLAVGVAVSIGLAVSGWGYWALVGMAVGTSIAVAVGSWLAFPWLPDFPKRRSGTRPLLHFDGKGSQVDLMAYVSYNMEKLLLGRFWGPAALGLYGTAYQLIHLPSEALNAAVGPVAASVLSRTQNDPDRRRILFTTGFSAIVSLTIPITLTAALFAEEITLSILGPKWLGAAPVVRLLAPMALAFSLINPLVWLMTATARRRENMGIVLLIQVVMVLGILAGLRYGPNGVALAYSLSLIGLAVPVIAWSTWRGSLRVEDVVEAVKRPFLAALVAAAVGLSLNLVLKEALSPFPRLIVGVSVVIGLYAWFLLIVMGQKASYADLLEDLFPSAKRHFLDLLRSRLETARTRLKRNYVVCRGSALPRPEMRAMVLSREYSDDEFFLESAIAEARRLATKMGCTPSSKVVDIGCGVGRLPIGLLREIGPVSYWGFDVVRPWIRWCQKYIGRHHPSFRFLNLDVKNEQYNPFGEELTERFRFPLTDGHADIIYLWGLFTNMAPSDMRIYVSEISRIVREGGRVFLTACVEDNVPTASINPQHYVDYPLTNPLHVVRYEKDGLFSTFARHGLIVEEFAYHKGVHCNQSEIYLRKTKIRSHVVAVDDQIPRRTA